MGIIVYVYVPCSPLTSPPTQPNPTTSIKAATTPSSTLCGQCTPADLVALKCAALRALAATMGVTAKLETFKARVVSEKNPIIIINLYPSPAHLIIRLPALLLAQAIKTAASDKAPEVRREAATALMAVLRPERAEDDFRAVSLDAYLTLGLKVRACEVSVPRDGWMRLAEIDHTERIPPSTSASPQ